MEFGHKSPTGDWFSVCPLEQGAKWSGFGRAGTMLNVAPVSTKYLSRVNSSVKKMSPAFAGKCMALAVACAGVAAELVRVRRLFSFPTKHRVKYTCEPCGRSSCEIYTPFCQGCERIEIRAARRATFGEGVAAPFVALLPVCRSWAHTSLCHGGRNRGVVASPSIPRRPLLSQ
jgi:hypothetical protein